MEIIYIKKKSFTYAFSIKIKGNENNKYNKLVKI